MILQNEIPEQANVVAAREAKARGAKVILNAAPAQKLADELAGFVDILVVNRVEAQMLSGKPSNTFAEAIVAAENLAAKNRDIIITLGGEGLFVAQAGVAPVTINPIKVNVVSTHGAGDCFIGQLASSIAAGMSVIEAARSANATAASFVGGNFKAT